MAEDPTARSSPISPAGRDRALGRARDVRRRVEAVALGGGDEPLGSELRAEGGEHRVARLGEGDDERTSAVLAVGVLEVDAFEHGLLLDGIGLLWVGDPRLERARRRDHLERRSGRLQAREGDPGEGEHLPRARLERHDTADAGAQGGDRRLLDRQRDRGADGGGLVRGRALEHAGARRRARRPASRAGAGRRSARGPTRRPPRRAAPRARTSSARRSGGIGPSWPTTWGASSDGEERSSPLASTVRSRASSVARAGIFVTRRRRSPAASPGKTSARDQSMPSPVAGRTTSPATVPNARVGMRTGTR